MMQVSGDFLTVKNLQRYNSAAGLTIAYGINDRLSASLKNTYAWLYTSWQQKAIYINGSLYLPEMTIEKRNNGIGDGNIGAQFSIIPMHVLDQKELVAGLDVGIPWSPSRKMVNGVELPVDVQTGIRPAFRGLGRDATAIAPNKQGAGREHAASQAKPVRCAGRVRDVGGTGDRDRTGAEEGGRIRLDIEHRAGDHSCRSDHNVARC
mgnify:CR=1 FL=1